MMTLREIGARVRALRAVRGWGQAELAQRLGTSVSSVSRLENGLHDVTFREVLALAQIFGLSLAMLLDSPAFPEVSATDTALLLTLLRVAGRLPQEVLRSLVVIATAIDQAYPAASASGRSILIVADEPIALHQEIHRGIQPS